MSQGQSNSKKHEPIKVKAQSLDEAMAELKNLENETQTSNKDIRITESTPLWQILLLTPISLPIKFFSLALQHKVWAALVAVIVVFGLFHFQEHLVNKSINPFKTHFQEATGQKIAPKPPENTSSDQEKRQSTSRTPAQMPVGSPTTGTHGRHFVYVKTFPSGAQVYVQNQLATPKTPGYTFFTSPKATTIVVKKKGYAPQRILATPGTQVDVHLTPLKK